MYLKDTSELETNMDSFGQQEDDETYEEQCQELEEADADTCEEINTEIKGEMHPTSINTSTSRQMPFFTDGLINEQIRSLNEEQQKVFDVLHKRSRNYIKSLRSKTLQILNAFYIFITDEGGVGKSHLMEIYINKGISPQNYLNFSLNLFVTLVQNFNGTHSSNP